MTVSTMPKGQHIYSTEVYVRGTNLSLNENGWYYAIIQLSNVLPSNAEMIGAMWTSSFDCGVFVVPTENKRLCFMSSAQMAVQSNYVTVFYILT